MTLAAILAIYFLSVGGPGLGSPADMRASAAQGQAPEQNSAATSQAQPPPGQTTSPAAASTTSQPQTTPSPAKPRARHRKTAGSDCSNSPATAATDAHSTPADAHGATTAKPCPPPKVIIKNGGSDEPIVELKGDTSAGQASYQRFTTEQLNTATEENLKKIAGHELNTTQQEMVSQIKQFMEQSKSAIAAGDLGRGHNLAMKARLLSDELVKP
ncbi:MAG: hypothetical protein ABSH02_05695 [Candidatus Sulfotelmatobacter sp.]|jgi:cytoskeletal protein RodZ